MNDLLNNIKRLRSIAEIGLLYAKDQYDKERYTELKEISFQLMSNLTDRSLEDLKFCLPLSVDYPTAKVDIRGLVISEDNKVLLVKEMADNKWSLPGGWGDIGFSAKEIIIKEFKEETGLDVIAERLLAVFDKKMHPHPPQPFYVYKFVFYCKAVSTDIVKGFDVLDVGYFDIMNLPPLSEDRILKSQLELCFNKIVCYDERVYFD